MNNFTSQRRKIIDYRRTWENRSEFLINFFENFDYITFFNNNSLDALPSVFDSIIFRAWDNFGIKKFVDKFSKPWFTPQVKANRRTLRYFERQIKRLKKSDSDFICIHGNFCNLFELYDIYNFYKHDYFDSLKQIKDDCLDFTNRLLESNVHRTVKKLYKCRESSIPTIRVLDSEKKVISKASDDLTRTEIFNQQFLQNTVHSGFPVDERAIDFFVTE